MKKRIPAIFLMVIVCFSLSVPVFALETPYIVDETGTLTESEIQELNGMAETLSDEAGMDFLYVYTYEDLDEYVRHLSLGKRGDQILMIENEEYWNVYGIGAAAGLLDQEMVDALREAFDYGDGGNDAQTLSGSVASYLYAGAKMAEEGLDAHTVLLGTSTRVVDMAGVLSSGEDLELLAELDEISQRQQFDLVVVTAGSLDGKSSMDYADDFYGCNGYGFGEQRDGVLLLVNIADCDWWISAYGNGTAVFTDAGLDYIGEQILPQLDAGDYAGAFHTFAGLCDRFITKANSGKPYDTGNMPGGRFPAEVMILIGLAAGVIAAGLITFKMKKGLVTAHPEPSARSHIREGSLNVTEQHEDFLYSDVKREGKKKKNAAGEGNSGKHTSSSGTVILPPAAADGTAKKYRVDYCGAKSWYSSAKDFYQAGTEVELHFDLIATDTDYRFSLDGGAEKLDMEHTGKGIVLRFTMPDHDVKLQYSCRNTMEQSPSVNGSGG